MCVKVRVKDIKGDRDGVLKENTAYTGQWLIFVSVFSPVRGRAVGMAMSVGSPGPD